MVVAAPIGAVLIRLISGVIAKALSVHTLARNQTERRILEHTAETRRNRRRTLD